MQRDPPLFVGIDVGSGGVRALAGTGQGNVVGRASWMATRPKTRKMTVMAGLAVLSLNWYTCTSLIRFKVPGGGVQRFYLGEHGHHLEGDVLEIQEESDK